MCGFRFAFEDAQQLGIGCQISNYLIGLATSVSLREKIQAAIHPLDGEGCERLMERLRHRIGEIDQNNLEQPGGPHLHLDCILSAAPKISQTQPAFDDGIGIFDPPALPIQGDPIGGWQTLGIQFVAQVAIPFAALEYFNQTD